MDLSGYSLPIIAGAVTFTGLVVVFIALIGLWGLVAAFGKFFIGRDSKPKAPTQPPVTAPKAQPAPAPVATQNVAPAMQVEDGIGDEIVAVIAAAVAAISGGSAVAIRSVRRAKETRSSWAQAGLMQNTQPF